MKFVPMLALNALLVLVLALICSTARAQQREAVVYDLGPEVFSNYRLSNGYGWYATGYVYPAGTYDDRPACEYDSSGFGVKPVGTYAIYGTTGTPGNHIARYRVTVNGVSHYFQAAAFRVFDDDGRLKNYLFDLLHIKTSGQQPSLDDPQSFVEFSGRSSQCFGGTVKLYLGVGPDPPLELPQFSEHQRWIFKGDGTVQRWKP
jgi:hypothetical protein